MIRSLLLTAMAFVALAVTPAMSAVGDTAFVPIYGPLVEVTSSTFTIDNLGNGAERLQFRYDASTEQHGCTFDKASLGTNVFVEAEYSTLTDYAVRVYFEGCTPKVHLEGEVRSINGNEFGIRILPPFGTEETRVRVVESTLLTDCLGLQLEFADFSLGEAVRVTGELDGDVIVASEVIRLSNCPEYITSNATFVSLVDGGIRVRLADGSDVDLLFTGDINGDTVRANVAYTCDGSFREWADVTAGTELSVMYASMPDGENLLLFGIILEGCPQAVNGIVLSRDGNNITIETYTGETITVTADENSQLHTCLGAVATVELFEEGAVVSGQFIDDNGVNRLLQLYRQDDCNRGKDAIGVVTDVSASSITILTFEGASRTFAVNDSTMVAGCNPLLFDISAINLGDTVLVYTDKFGAEENVLFIQILRDCDQDVVSGIIESVGTDNVVLNLGDRTETLAFDEASQFSDCLGQFVELSEQYVGKHLTAYVDRSQDPVLITAAYIEDGCPTPIFRNGIVTAVSGTSVTIHDGNESVTVAIADYTVVTDSLAIFVPLSDLSVGSPVCVVSYDDNGTETAVHIAISSDCAIFGWGKVRTTGQIVSLDGDMLNVNVDGHMTTFALSSTTTIQKGRTATGRHDLVEGAAVSVSSDRRINGITPLASNVIVMNTTTNVDNDVDTKTLSLGPNPATDMVTVVTPYDVIGLTVYAVTGEQVLSAEGSSFDVSALPTGPYYVTIRTANGTTTTPLQVVR